ncbi:MAG: magnesium chelatase subunit D [Gammaproteobacteria bacterium]|nr:magnesium chelatase subunit D [Pseudomonadales bacterium]MCP5347022.1 magnesium chelatase subunit D [Pseudomonadales bacterium]
MSEVYPQSELTIWTHYSRAAALFAVDPAGLHGVVLRSRPGPVRDCWLAQLHELLPVDSPWRRMPVQVGDERLLGGLDLSATLRSGRPVAERGLLAECHGGVLLVAMAERLEVESAVRLGAVMDRGVVVLERGGLSRRLPARLGIVALDEGIDDETVPTALADRCAIHLNLEQIPVSELGPPVSDREAVAAARVRLGDVRIGAELIEVLCRAAIAFGIESLRPAILSIRVARSAAALAGRCEVSEADIAVAAQLVFGSRATALPETQEDQLPEPESEPERGESAPESQHSQPGDDDFDSTENPAPQALDDRVLEATRAAIPPQLLQQLRYPDPGRSAVRSSARSAARRRPARRGRRVGTRPGDPASGARLNLVETLRVAAPWQRVRRARSEATGNTGNAAVRLRREDFRVNRYQQRAATTTVFAVDASGSAALHRLAEAKGAVELLLAESYQRRDQVALVSFRGLRADLLLAPTRSLVRAKRSLAELPGGGGTPLAAGIRLALDVALGILRKGETPVVILLTDGRANVALDGKGDRQQADRDAHEAARELLVQGITTLLVDTSPRPRPAAQQLAASLGAGYLALPHADAERLTGAARSVLTEQRARCAV